MNVLTLNLYIVQEGKVVATCPAPWRETARNTFEKLYQLKKLFNQQVDLIEAISEGAAVEKYNIRR